MLLRIAPVFALAAAVALVVRSAPPPPRPYLRAPALNEYNTFNPGGTTIIGNGRLLTPIGTNFPVGRNPHNLLMSPDGETLFVVCDGTGYIVKGWTTASPVIDSFSPGAGGGRRRGTGAGAAFSKDGSLLYWSAGDNGRIHVINAAEKRTVGEIDLNTPVGGKTFEDSVAQDVALSTDGRYLYAADVTNFRLAVIRLTDNRVVSSIPVGRYPYALTVSGTKVFVAHIGQFEYSPIDPPDPKLVKPGEMADPRGLGYPPFGYPSKEAEEGTIVEGRRVAGLGNPNALPAFSVYGVDAADPEAPKVILREKTGLLIGAPTDSGKTVGGSAPNYVVSDTENVWVSNNNNDVLERISIANPQRKTKARITPSPLTAALRGVGPAGMVRSPDGRRLYVAETGINAVGVFDAQTLKEIGHIPTAWYPYRVVVSKDGRKLSVICFKGFGEGPSGGSNVPDSPFRSMRGVLTVLDVPSDADLTRHTRTVLANNGMVDRTAEKGELSSPLIPTEPGTPSSEIKYVVFITKENHTYDAIFDRIPGAKHDPSLLRWGLTQTISAPNQPTLNNVPVMTNHNALAREFSISDNFYMEPEASGVGHRWLVGVQPNNLMQMTYTLGWGFKSRTSAPGRRYSMGSNGSILPEEYPEAGSMWEHLASNGRTFRNYGEGYEFPGDEEVEKRATPGNIMVGNYPMSKVLYDNTCREFPIYNNNIPDQYRADVFIKDYTERFLSGRHKMPHFINIAICNDHGAGLNAAKGYPYLASWMADNDLALGRIVEFLSKTPQWKNMAIFVTQDDSGGEPDHVDKLRSVLLVISPYAKRGYVSHRHTTITSMHRTLYQILGIPALNMWDALANDFSDCFTTKPDFRPYTAKPVDPRIFDPRKAKNPKDPTYAQARRMPSPTRMDDPDEMEEIERMGRRDVR
jgi:YVTN family beta-propeller protein